MSVDVASKVIESYTQIDVSIDQFTTATGLTCPPGCGQCCENPDVVTTPLEMLPLAFELFRQGEADNWLQKAYEKNRRGSCVFYKPDPFVPGNGRCQVYAWRPSVCRLFGFSSRINKRGEPELVGCKRHKATTPDVVTQAQEAIAQGKAHAPNMAEWTQQVTSLDPALGSQRLPINEALTVAIERVGLWLQMASEDTSNISCGELPL